MSNCTGYPFGLNVDLCTEGAVGNGNTANLLIRVSSFGGFIDGTTTIMAWDGTELMVDLLADNNFTINDFSPDYSDAGFYSDRCDTLGAVLTIIPDPGDVNTGMVMLEFTIGNCDGAEPTTTQGLGTQTTTTTPPPRMYVDDRCGSMGPHTISEMIPFTLDPNAACNII